MVELRNNPLRVGLIVLGCLTFVSIGALMWTWGPPTYSIFPWSIPLQRIIGLLIILFFGGCAGVMLLISMRPILRMDQAGIDDPQRKLQIRWEEIRQCESYSEFGGQKVQWLGLDVYQPEKYKHIAALDKKLGLAKADIIFDLTNVSQRDFSTALKFIESMMANQNNRGDSHG